MFQESNLARGLTFSFEISSDYILSHEICHIYIYRQTSWRLHCCARYVTCNMSQWLHISVPRMMKWTFAWVFVIILFSPFLHFLLKDQKRVGVNTNFIFIVLVYSIYIYIGCNVLAHLTRKPMGKHLFSSTAKFPLLIKAAYLLMGEIRVPKKKTFNKYMPLLVT